MLANQAAVLAALVLGAVALAGAVFAEGAALLIGLGAAAAGLAVLRRFADPVPRGIGTSFVVLGAYATGAGLLAAGDGDAFGLSNAVLVLYGLPAVALLAVAATGIRAWHAGAGALSTMLVVLLMAADEATTDTVSTTMLVLALVLAVVVVRAPATATWGNVAAAAAATATAFALGGSPFVTLGSTPPGSDELLLTPASGASAAVIAAALLVAGVLVLLAVARGDRAGGFLAGAVLATPVGIVALGADDLWFALAGVPALVAVLALVALRVPRVGAALASAQVALRERPPSFARTAAAIAVVAATAATCYVVQAVPLFAWPSVVKGSVAFLVLLGVAALAHWLSDGAGVACAVVALVGLHLARPFHHLLPPGGGWQQVVGGVLTLVAALAVAAVLVRRHRHPAVVAAAAYLLVAGLAAAVGSVLATPADGVPFEHPGAAVAVLVVPLVLVGVPAAVAALRTRTAAHGQAAGAVVLTAAGFLPLKALVATAAGEGPRALVLEGSLAPVTPTDWLGATYALRDAGGSVLAAVVVVVLLALVLAVSAARRPSPSLVAAAALVLLGVVQITALVS